MKTKTPVSTQPTIRTIAALALCLVLALIFAGCAEDKTSDLTGTPDGQLTNSRVEVIEKKTDNKESSYRVGTELVGTDLSHLGQTPTEILTQEWNKYDSMTWEERTLSSRIWGIVYFESDTWDECEEGIGVTVNNPLESLSWLNKTGHIGMESANPDRDIKHIQVTVNAANEERKPREISATAGYSTDNARITLTATLAAKTGTYTTGCVYNGYATYEQATATTKSGTSVLIVTTNGSNNNGYYQGDFYDPTAYWVEDNVFYELRVLGDAADKADIQAVLDRILAEI